MHRVFSVGGRTRLGAEAPPLLTVKELAGY